MREKQRKVKLYFRQGWVSFPVFGGYVVYFVETNDFDLAIQHLKLKSHGPCEGAEAMTWVAKDGGYSYILVKPKSPIHHIVHECWHAIYHMLTFRNVSLDDEENIAYHLDYLVSKAMKFYGKEK